MTQIEKPAIEFNYFKDEFDLFGLLDSLNINILANKDSSFVLEKFNKYGIRIPENYTFDPQEFLDSYDKYYINPQNYWDELSFDNLIEIYGPKPIYSNLLQLDYT